MNRYKNMFKKLNLNKEGCFIPFITIGDPSVELFFKIIDIFVQEGADALELGIPFSDPLADGPIIQNANSRVLSNGINLSICFKIINQLRKKYPLLPIGILVYVNIIFNKKIINFYKLCENNGVDSVLIPDLPIEEYSKFHHDIVCKNVDSILVCPPNADDNLLKKISKQGKGYIYLLSRSGVTGIKNKICSPNINIINKLKKYNSVPIIQGFGVLKTNQIISSLSLGLDGVICGSVIIKLIEKYHNQNDIMLQKIKKLIKNLKNSTKKII